MIRLFRLEVGKLDILRLHTGCSQMSTDPNTGYDGITGLQKTKAQTVRSLHHLTKKYLQFGHILGLETLWTGYYIEFDIVAFIKGFESLSQNSAVMHENIITGIATDETITFFVVKPLNGSLFFHLIS